MLKITVLSLIISATTIANAADSAFENNEILVVNKLIFSADDSQKNKKAIRKLNKILRKEGQVFVWVVLNPQVVGFNVSQDELSVGARRIQAEAVRRALNDVLSDLHVGGEIERAPTYFQNGVSELVKILRPVAVEKLMDNGYVQQITLHPTS